MSDEQPVMSQDVFDGAKRRMASGVAANAMWDELQTFRGRLVDFIRQETVLTNPDDRSWIRRAAEDLHDIASALELVLKTVPPLPPEKP